MFSSAYNSTVVYLVNAQRHTVLLKKQKYRSQPFAIGLPKQYHLVRAMRSNLFRATMWCNHVRTRNDLGIICG